MDSRLRRAATVSLIAGALAVLAARAQAEDRVSVRGMYFREPSTRIVQPLVVLTKDLPGGLDVGAHYALDAITSASIAQGISQDGIHTEFRNEAGIGVGKRWGRTRAALNVRESREPDYISHSGGLSVTRGVWDNSGVVGLNAAVASDTSSSGPLENANTKYKLRTYFAAAAYEQSIFPTVRAQLGYEVMYQDGYLGNPYRRGSNGYEEPPDSRVRHAISPRVAKYFPAAGLGLQLHYRFYVDHWLDDAVERATDFAPPRYGKDPWRATAHTVEGRVFKELSSDVEVRLAYRFHAQKGARFYCNTYTAKGGSADCYGMFALFHSTDEKVGPMSTHMPELKLYWTPRVFAQTPFLRHFAEGTVEISYAYLVQMTHFGNGHFLQSGYTLPF